MEVAAQLCDREGPGCRSPWGSPNPAFADLISCTGPTTRCIRGSSWRSPAWPAARGADQARLAEVAEHTDGVGTNSLAIIPPPTSPALPWRNSWVEIEGPGPTRSLTGSSKIPMAPP